MKVVIAPDKFKGSLTAVEACLAIEKGIKKVDKTAVVEKVPLADGGEGTMDVIESYLKPIRVEVEVLDPLSRPIQTYYLKQESTAFIEMASASGLQLLESEERDPRYTTTFGTGQLIKDALERGVNRIYLMIGGSATNDAGIGMAQALGYSFKDKTGAELLPAGESLEKIASVDYPMGDPPGFSCEFIVLSDVQNVLFGQQGAAFVYGAQKGADNATIKQLDDGLRHFAEIMANGIENHPGTGAAGGLGYGAMSFLNAKITSGIQIMMELTNLERSLDGADLIITGEGKLDSQTLSGKVVSGVELLSKAHNIPIGILCGIKDDVDTNDLKTTFVGEIIYEAKNEKDSMKNAGKYLTQLAQKHFASFIKS